MIKVCDAIMGSGKSQSTISYINDHKNEKFVYITPYLDEATRIRDGCPDLQFAEPSKTISSYNFSKLEHTKYLLEKGRNITTTHAAFRSYTNDMLESIRRGGYTLFVDEAVEVFQEAKYSDGDIDVFLESGYVQYESGVYSLTGKEYTGDRLRDLFEMLQCNNLIKVDSKAKGTQYYYWTLPREIFTSFKEVYILTYLFDSQEIKYFMDINKIDYKYIGIRHEGSEYHFTEYPEYIPSYVENLENKLRIFSKEKINCVGDNRNALSANWLKTHTTEREVLRKNLYTFMRYHNQCSCNDIMWSTFNGNVKSLRGRGFYTQNVAFNKKATNDYRDRSVLAYCVNIFAHPNKVRFFARYGITYDENGYALSTMIQWIWRSAIRDGKEIQLYIPSRRMRELLVAWIKDTSKKGSYE